MKESNSLKFPDFVKIVRSYIKKFSSLQLEKVFKEYSKGSFELNSWTMSVWQFWDIFFPQLPWSWELDDKYLTKEDDNKSVILSDPSEDINYVLKGQKRPVDLTMIQEINDEDFDKDLEVDSDISHVSIPIDDALMRKVEKEVPIDKEGKKSVEEKSGFILNPSIVKEVKIDKSLDKLFKGFCLKMRKFAEDSGKQPFDLALDFLWQKEDEELASDVKWEKKLS